MNAFLIRDFQYPGDLVNILDLWEHAGSGVHLGRSDTPQEILKKLQRDPDLFLVAQFEDQIIGAVLGGYDGRRGIVYHLAVAKEHREKGIGSALMKELEDRLRAKGCLKCYLLVTYENLGAIEFYEERGWSRMELYIYGKELL